MFAVSLPLQVMHSHNELSDYGYWERKKEVNAKDGCYYRVEGDG
jgi:hypothetical protein